MWLHNLKHFLSVSKSYQRRKQIRQEDLKIVETDTKEVLIEKFLLLRDAYDELKDDTTRLEFELESLKDAQDDGEEEVDLWHYLSQGASAISFIFELYHEGENGVLRCDKYPE